MAVSKKAIYNMKVVTAYQMITAHFAGPVPVAYCKLQSYVHWLHRVVHLDTLK